MASITSDTTFRGFSSAADQIALEAPHLLAAAERYGASIQEQLRRLEAQWRFCLLWNARLGASRTKLAGINPHMGPHEVHRAIMKGHDHDSGPDGGEENPTVENEGALAQQQHQSSQQDEMAHSVADLDLLQRSADEDVGLAALN